MTFILFKIPTKVIIEFSFFFPPKLKLKNTFSLTISSYHQPFMVNTFAGFPPPFSSFFSCFCGCCLSGGSQKSMIASAFFPSILLNPCSSVRNFCRPAESRKSLPSVLANRRALLYSGKSVSTAKRSRNSDSLRASRCLPPLSMIS